MYRGQMKEFGMGKKTLSLYIVQLLVFVLIFDSSNSTTVLELFKAQ